MTDVPVDVGGAGATENAGAALPEGLTEAEAEELKNELYKVEEEISTLRQVLAAKERHAWDLKRKLGQTPLNQLKQNFSKGLQEVQMSNAYVKTSETLGAWNEKVAQSDVYVSASSTLEDWNEKVTHSEAYSKDLPGAGLPFHSYKKTQETLSQAGQKTSAALSTVGTAISRKFGDMRNSPTFKSFEDRVGSLKGSCVASVATKINLTRTPIWYQSKVVGGKENGTDGLHSPTGSGEKSPQDNAPF